MGLAILCPGQGHQKADNLVWPKENDENLAYIQKYVREAVGKSPHEIFEKEHHFKNKMAQPLICAITLSRWHQLKDLMPKPIAVLGYSIGELAANAISGSYDIHTCMALASCRAAVMDSHSPPDSGLMAFLGLASSVLDKICIDHQIEPAIINSTDHVICAGLMRDLQQAAIQAESMGGTVHPLNVRVPSHSHFLKGAADEFCEKLKENDIHDPHLPIISSVTGSVLQKKASVISALSKQIDHAIQWEQCIDLTIEMGTRVFLELGPGSALTKMLHKKHPQIKAKSIESFSTVKGVHAWVRDTLDLNSH